MRYYGLVGYPLHHSFSPGFFEKKFREEGIQDASYTAFPLPEIEDLPALILEENLLGLNVTIPHKEAALPFLHHLDTHAAAIGAVNCISISSGVLTGYNTDWTGFRESLLDWLFPLPKSALILGTGGASKAVAYALQSLGIPHRFVSRMTLDNALRYEDLTAEILRQFPLIINTTPLGTWPDVSSKPPLDYNLLTSGNTLYDLVYNPGITAFLEEGIRRDCRVKNGLQMLCIQAEESFKIWQQKL